MDNQRDFKAFQELVDQLNAALRGGFKATDAMIAAYWTALQDVHLSEVRAHVERIIATATQDTPFPRPRDLRNRAPMIAGPNDARGDAAQRMSEENWRGLRAQDPVKFEVEYRIAIAARELAQLDARDPGFEVAQAEFQRWMGVRYAPREQQEAFVARYVNCPTTSPQTGFAR